MPLASQEHFVLIYNGDLIEAEERREKLKSAAEARKRARSAQRRKKFAANYNTVKWIPFQTCTTCSDTMMFCSLGYFLFSDTLFKVEENL